MNSIWKRFKKFVLNSIVLGILIVPMNLITMFDYNFIFSDESTWFAKIFLGTIILIIWNFMCVILDINAKRLDTGSGDIYTGKQPEDNIKRTKEGAPIWTVSSMK